MRDWRIKSLICFFTFLYLVLIFHIYNLQIEKRAYFLTKAQNQERASGTFKAPRGNIYFVDRNNNLIPAALNKEYPMVYAVPKEIYNENKYDYSQLSQIVNIPVEELKKKLSKPNDLYELLIRKATPEQINQIKNLNLKGIYISDQLLRFYPFGDLASHLLGFVNSDSETEKGVYGLELSFNKELSGQPGEIKEGKIIEPKHGKDLILTIDRNIQSQAEEILKKLINQYQAVGGSVIVQEPQTGKILAMGSFPNFDPNNYSKFEVSTFLNPAVQSIYEPGSVLKLITMAAGIDSGKITPETTYVDTGSITLNGKTIKNWDLKAHGLQTMTGVIEQSINTGAVFAQRKTGPDIFYNYLIKFGFSELTNIALPGEVRGNINSLKNGREIDFATASFGQGVAVTPIELISAISAIANGGNLMKPIILADEKPQVVRRVISEETAKAVTKMMISAVEKNKVAVIPNYLVAGKTGTAFVPRFGGKGYTDDVINTYVGFAPAFNPKFVILIKLNKPKGSPLAGQTVVPAFRELAQFILNYYNIAPDKM
jgi:stage V sporulation protein D (sporulation-specific penicillin-binding protein)